MTSPALESLIYKEGPPSSLQVLDQLLLPHQTVYVDVPDVQTTWSVIRSMQIRGEFVVAVAVAAAHTVDAVDVLCRQYTRIH
jgi:methylthioribose-1-phosphate isomerase